MEYLPSTVDSRCVANLCRWWRVLRSADESLMKMKSERRETRERERWELNEWTFIIRSLLTCSWSWILMSSRGHVMNAIKVPLNSRSRVSIKQSVFLLSLENNNDTNHSRTRTWGRWWVSRGCVDRLWASRRFQSETTLMATWITTLAPETVLSSRRRWNSPCGW